MNYVVSQSQTTHAPAFLQANVSLRDKNWFKTGGAAQWFCSPATIQEFQQAIIWASSENQQITLIGEGANILVSDEGIKGLVIIPHLKSISHINVDTATAHVTAGAGSSMDMLIEYCLNNHLIGLEEFSGIPGTVGGSVFINIHYFQFLLSSFLVKATVIHAVTGELLSVDAAWFAFGYNTSRLHAKDYFLVEATFQVAATDEITTAYARGRKKEIMRHRFQRYPNSNTCGSFFRNFFEHEVSVVSNGRRMIFIAYYLDKIGVKGALSVGGASVSYQHANMLITNTTATSSDVIQLARTMQELVQKEFAILPQAECQFLGFSEYPLHT